ncbi:MAG: hypothetical protein ABIQ02_01410 [Saprospiraceae bacterium]
MPADGFLDWFFGAVFATCFFATAGDFLATGTGLALAFEATAGLATGFPFDGAFTTGFFAAGFLATAAFEGLPFVAATLDDLLFFCVAILTGF